MGKGKRQKGETAEDLRKLDVSSFASGPMPKYKRPLVVAGEEVHNDELPPASSSDADAQRSKQRAPVR